MNLLKMDAGARERRARQRLARHGYGVYKSRVQTPNDRNRGGYMVYEVCSNEIAAGENFACSLDELEIFGCFLDELETVAALQTSGGVPIVEE